MPTVLYRKYRPQAFRELTNQNHIKITLEREVAQDKIGHAYVFSGPRGTGKTSTARIFAKALNCLQRKEGEGEPCGECSACREITDGKALDIIEIDAASHTGVEMVREAIIETVRFAPSRMKFKIFIIDEAHMLSTPAWNALLKTLEEPPKHVIFILATTEAHKIPSTILSRCQRFDFKRVGAKDLIERLKFVSARENKIVAPQVFTSIARLAEGSVRDAESLLEQVFTLGEKEITEDHALLVLPKSSLPEVLDFLELIFKNDARGAIDLLNHYLFDGYDLSQFSADSVETLRKMMLWKVKAKAEQTLAFDIDEEYENKLKKLADQATIARLLFLTDLFLRRKLELKNAPIPQLPLELAVLEACADSRAGFAENVLPRKESGSGQSQPQKNINPVDKKNASGQNIEEAPKSPKTTDLSDQAASLNQKQKQNLPTLADLKNKWQAILDETQNLNHSLAIILKTSEPVNLVDDTLQIGVRYGLHRDKINEEKNRLRLSELIEKQFNCRLQIEAVLVEGAKKDDNVLNEVLQTFGGSVIE